MNDKDYIKLQSEIIRQHGSPEWELNMPVNESARKLRALKIARQKERLEVEATKELLAEFKEIDVPSADPMSVPDQIVKDSWLTPFDSDQKRIVLQWLENIKQDPDQLASATNLDRKVVKQTLRSEAFKLLRTHLELAYKSLAKLEAVIKLRQLANSRDEKIAFQASKLIANDAGLYKGESLDVTEHRPQEVLLDAKTEEKLRKLGDQLLDE